MRSQSIDLITRADLIVRRLLAVKPGETVAIICDPYSVMEMAYALAGVVQSVGGEYTIMMMPTFDTTRSNDLTRIVQKGLEEADCLIGMTGVSGGPTYSAAVKKRYLQKRLRGISMVYRNEHVYLRGGAMADYDLLLEDGKKLAELWAAGNIMRITTPSGTDLSAPIASNDVIVECGFATEPGQEAAFSDGEVSSRPLEGTAEGVIVVDGPICHIGMPREPIRLTVEKGRVIQVEGISSQAHELRHIIHNIENADNVAEFGIGLNPNSQRNGDFEEEKKARGLVHIAIGDNIFYGGQTHSAVHMDMVLYEPTVWLDEHLLVKEGNVQLD